MLMRSASQVALALLKGLLGHECIKSLLLSLFHFANFILFVFAECLEVLLLALHFIDFFFLENFSSCQLEGLTAEHGENWLNFIFEDEELIVFDEGLFRNALEFRHLVWSWGSVDFELSLTSNLVDWRLVSQLRHELVSLNIDVLLAWWSLWRLYVTREEFLSRFCSLLLQTFWVVLALVGLEKLVGVRASWDDHGRVSRATVHSLIEGNVLREVHVRVLLAIRVLILRFGWHNTRVGSEARRRV